jgi:glutamine amidotransferase
MAAALQIVLVDSPVANTANIARALRTCGASLQITNDAAVIEQADKLVLPGVGSFAAAMRWLVENRIDIALREAVARGAALLGICVGHQLLFDVSHEMGMTSGLGLTRGDVRKLDGRLPVPQIGWNRVDARGPLFAGVENEAFYFVNSYAATNADDEIASADYGGPFTAAVQNGRVFGVQFHPEKSSSAGLRVLRNFIAWT